MKNSAIERMYNDFYIEYASTFLQKMVGLALRDDFEGVMIFTYAKPTNFFIHTCGMFFPLDITCFDENNEVVREIKNMKPWKVVYVKGVKTFVEKKSEEYIKHNKI